MDDHTETVSISEIVGGIFDEALSAPLNSLRVDEADADKWLKDRVRRLSLFDTNGISPELRKQYVEAIKITQMGSSLCSTSKEDIKMLTPIGDLSDTDIFSRSQGKLNRLRIEVVEKMDARSLSVWNEIYLALHGEIANPTEAESIKDVLDWWCRDWDELDKITGYSEATLLISTHHQLKYERELLLALVFFNTMARGIFYHTIVKKHGSKLEAEATKRQVTEEIKDIPWEVFSHIPGIGELLGPLKILTSLLLTLADRDRALEDQAARMKDDYDAAKGFIEVYNPVLFTWCAWKVNLVNMLIKCMGDYLPDFLPLPNL